MDLKSSWERFLTCGVIAVWVGISVFAHTIYESSKSAMDNRGWIRHAHDTPVWIGGDWLEGEYRVCQMPGRLYGKLPDLTHLLCGSGDQAPGMAWPSDFVNSLSPQEEFGLFEQYKSDWKLTDHYFHVLPVNYWGRLDRREFSTFSWRCQRKPNGLTCYAVN